MEFFLDLINFLGLIKFGGPRQAPNLPSGLVGPVGSTSLHNQYKLQYYRETRTHKNKEKHIQYIK